MAKHTYKITVEAVDDQKTVTFETQNHDDLFKIFEMAQMSQKFPKDEGLSLVLGLKLFSEVMLANKAFKAFDVLRPVFGAFMKSFKDEMRNET